MTCDEEGKRQYPDEKSAHYARRLMVAKNIKNGVIGSPRRAMQVYKCKSCNFYHVGHSDIYLLRKPK